MFSYVMHELPRMFSVRSVVSAFDVIRPQNFYFAGEMHNFWELVYVVDGKATATADERVYSLSSGQLIFHKPMEFHRIWSADGTAPHLLIVSFDADGEKMKDFENRVVDLDLHKEEMLKDILAKAGAVLKQNAAEEKSSDRYVYLTHMTALRIESFLLELLHDRTAEEALQPLKEGETYRQIVRVLNEHCCEALSVRQIAALCNLSVSNLKKIFHTFSDKGVIKYFTCVKIRKAISWLDEGLSIAEISDRLAFSSQNYFHVVFRRETGCSPGDYRKRNRAAEE